MASVDRDGVLATTSHGLLLATSSAAWNPGAQGERSGIHFRTFNFAFSRGGDLAYWRALASCHASDAVPGDAPRKRSRIRVAISGDGASRGSVISV